MCLLISGKSNEIRATLLNTEGLLHDIYSSNSDGVGAMYVTSKRKLRTPKVLPRTLGECIAFIRQLPDDDRNLALHFRMKTHGHIDLTNCHPYDVIPGQIALMHNGILSQGNKADPTKSDTWHYIKDVVRPMLAEAPKMFLNQAWLNLIEEDISTSNRFAIMDSEGDLVILNRETGIEHAGLWFSNTYAWSPELLIPGYKKAYKFPKHWSQWEDDDLYGGKWHGGNVIALGNNPVGADDIDEDDELPDEAFSDLVWDAMSTSNTGDLTDLLLDYPLRTLSVVMHECEFAPSTGGYEPNKTEQELIDMLVAGDPVPLAWKIDRAATDATAKVVAEIMCWCGDWYGKAINADEDKAQPTREAEYEAAVQEFLENQRQAAAEMGEGIEIVDRDETELALTAGATATTELAAG